MKISGQKDRTGTLIPGFLVVPSTFQLLEAYGKWEVEVSETGAQYDT